MTKLEELVYDFEQACFAASHDCAGSLEKDELSQAKSLLLSALSISEQISGEAVNGAPERICVAQDSDGFWTCREAVLGSQEYVRADIEREWRYEALRLKALRETANSRAEAIGTARHWIANNMYEGDTNAVAIVNALSALLTEGE